MTVQLYHGDCLEIMPTLEAGSFDAIIADLPYGTTACKWDTVIPFAPLWAEYKRLIKPRGAIVLFGSQPFTSLLVTSNLEWFRYEWVWNKVNVTGWLDVKRRPMKKHENIAVFSANGHVYNPLLSGKATKSFGRLRSGTNKIDAYAGEFGSDFKQGIGYPQSIIEFQRPTNLTDKEHGLHPTQKPVALLEYLVRTYTNPGDVVLDNVMGSGTTMVACIQTGRRGVGIEKDAAYFEIAKRRVETAQLPLLEAV